jgi:FkbM family methyltransferase
MNPTQTSALLGVYSLARRSGLLDTSIGRSLFSSSYFLYKRYLEDPFHALVRARPELLRGGNVLDIGANIGYTCRLFARAIDPDFRVYAFEPEEFNFGLLERSASRTQGRAVAVRAAVGDHDGEIELWRNEHHHGDHRIATRAFRESGAVSQAVRVPITTIDTFVRSRNISPVRFIKVDVQGYELPVCRGMSETLRANPEAVLALEYMPEALESLGFSPQELLGWFEERKYNVYSLDRSGALKPGVPQIDARGYADLLFTKTPL